MTRPKTLASITAVGAFAVVTVAALSWYVGRPQATALADNTDAQGLTFNQHPSTSNSEFRDSPNNAPRDRNSPAPQTIKGITVRVTSAQIIATGIEIQLCYSTPDAGDWYPEPGHLSYGGVDVRPDEFGFLTETKADGVQMGERCALVRYRVDNPSSITTPISFSLGGIFAVPKEIPPCEDFQNRLNTNPATQKLGLKVECTENSDGSIALSLAGQLKSAPQGEAQKALDEITRGDVRGPWQFTLETLDK